MHDRLILMFLSNSLSKNTLKNIQNIVIVHFCSKMSTSCRAKSRRDGEKRMSNLDSAATHQLCSSKIFFCNAVLWVFKSRTTKPKLQLYHGRRKKSRSILGGGLTSSILENTFLVCS